MHVFSTRSFWLPVMLTTLVAALFGAVLARRGRELADLLEQQARLEAQVRELKSENAGMKAERDALLSSPSAIEKVAREDYGFAAPGEKVDGFESARPPVLGAAAAQPASVWGRVFSWRSFPVLLPASVFVVAAVVFAVWNAIAAAARDE